MLESVTSSHRAEATEFRHPGSPAKQGFGATGRARALEAGFKRMSARRSIRPRLCIRCRPAYRGRIATVVAEKTARAVWRTWSSWAQTSGSGPNSVENQHMTAPTSQPSGHVAGFYETDGFL